MLEDSIPKTELDDEESLAATPAIKDTPVETHVPSTPEIAGDSKVEAGGEEGDGNPLEKADDFAGGEGDEEGDELLRRRDQLAARRVDSPPKKGRGRGRGRGRGAGRGRGKGNAKTGEDSLEDTDKAPKQSEANAAAPDSVDATAASAPPKRRKKNANKKGSNADASEALQSTCKRATKAKLQKPSPDQDAPEDEPQASQPAPKRATKKRSVPAPDKEEAQEAKSVEPAPKKSSRTKSKAAKADQGPPGSSNRGVESDEREELKKTIRTFQKSQVVVYWSRSAVALKIPKPDGGLSQAP